MSVSQRSSPSQPATPVQPAVQERPQPVDLRGRYSRIGISAVAAAARYQSAPDNVGPRATAADRSTARGWSRHS
jgi:hypothetical protein